MEANKSGLEMRQELFFLSINNIIQNRKNDNDIIARKWGKVHALRLAGPTD
jgi:hypothetical protein